jgi:hypothetical protein
MSRSTTELPVDPAQVKRSSSGAVAVAWMAVDIAAITAAALVIGGRAGAFSGFPKGYDTYAHISKVSLILTQFPHVLWNWNWYTGAQNFVGGFPPGYDGYHGIVALLVWAAGISITGAMLWVAALNTVMIVVGLYGFVRTVTGSRGGALIAAALVLGGPTQWDQLIRGGLYPRLWGWGCAAFALWAAAGYARKRTRLLFVLTVGFLALASFDSIAELFAAPLVAGTVAAMTYQEAGLIRRLTGLAAATFGLVAVFYLPELIARNQVGSQSTFTYWSPLPWGALVGHVPGGLAYFSPVLLPIVALAAIVAYVGRARLRTPPLLVGGMLACAGLALVVYCVIGHLDPGFKHYIAGVDTSTVLCYPEWFLAAAAGIVLSASGTLRRPVPAWHYAPLVAASIGAAAGLAMLVPVLPSMTAAFDGPGQVGTETVSRMIPNQPQERVVTNIVDTVEPLDVDSTLTQYAGAPAESELNPNWQYWAQKATSDPGWNPRERQFILDWYAEGWALTTPGDPETRVFASDPSQFKVIPQPTALHLFQVAGAHPIITASTAPTVLVIGDLAHYNLVLRALAEDDVGTRELIPIWGGVYADGVSEFALSHADAVMLYGAKSHDSGRAASILGNYVRSGGRLFIDSGDDPLSDMVAAGPSSPAPLSTAYYATIAGSWQFRLNGGQGILPNELKTFSPPSYAGTQTWQVAVAFQLAPWARPILSSHGDVVLVGGQFGAGQVIWSGLNLPYHIASFQNAGESALLARSLGAVTVRAGRLDVTGFNPDHVSASVTGRGVLVSEYLAAGWTATVNGVASPIEEAGPGMMYIPLPAHPSVVELNYGLTPADLVGVAMSALTLLFLLAYLCGVRLPTRVRQRVDLESALLVGRLLPRRVGVRATRQQLADLMTHPSPDVRRTALLALPAEQLEPYADILSARLREETDASVLDALRDLVVTHQWEPVSTPALLELRQWAASVPTTAARR